MTYEHRPSGYPASPPASEFFEPDCPGSHLEMGCQIVLQNEEVERCHLLDEQGYCTWKPNGHEQMQSSEKTEEEY